MRKLSAMSVAALALILVGASASDADSRGGRTGRSAHHSGRHHHHHGGAFISVGPSYWWGPSPYWWYGPWPYDVSEPGPVVVRRPPPYVEAPSEPEQGYWHYCNSARAYYTSVQTCPEAWVKVAPRSE